jgi:hypothetical protein
MSSADRGEGGPLAIGGILATGSGNSFGIVGSDFDGDAVVPVLAVTV